MLCWPCWGVVEERWGLAKDRATGAGAAEWACGEQEFEAPAGGIAGPANTADGRPYTRNH
jgi:hypothetical protein